MSSGKQTVASSGNMGIVNEMYGGIQNVSSDSFGEINVMNGRSQMFFNGTGTISVMNDGLQNMGFGTANTAIISVMNGGIQQAQNASSMMTISVMNNDVQSVGCLASGIISSMNSGSQVLFYDSSATGTVLSLNGGTQLVYHGRAVDTVVNGGTQLIIGTAIYSICINGSCYTTTAGYNGIANNTTINNDTVIMFGETATAKDITMTGGEYIIHNNNDGEINNIGGKFEFTGGQFDMTKRAENAFNPDSGVILTDSKYLTVKINDLQKAAVHSLWIQTWPVKKKQR